MHLNHAPPHLVARQRLPLRGRRARRVGDLDLLGGLVQLEQYGLVDVEQRVEAPLDVVLLREVLAYQVGCARDQLLRGDFG